MSKRLFRGVRQITTYEDVEVFAEHYDEAREKFEGDTEDVLVTGERESDYEVSEISSGHLDEIKE